MTAIKPVQITVAELIRDFNGGSSKFRTASALAEHIVEVVRSGSDIVVPYKSYLATIEEADIEEVAAIEKGIVR